MMATINEALAYTKSHLAPTNDALDTIDIQQEGKVMHCYKTRLLDLVAL